MRSFLQAITDVMRADWLDGRRPITLKELDPGAEFMPVRLNAAGPTLVLRPDLRPAPACPRPDCGLTGAANAALFPLFDIRRPGLTQLCDYVLFTERDDTLFVLLCECKTGRSRGGMPQILNTSFLVDWVLAMARHHGQPGRIPRVQLRGVIFAGDCKLRPGDSSKPCRYSIGPATRPDLACVTYPPATYNLTHFCA